MKKIKLFWYKVPFGKKNFGDELGPYLVEKLSGNKVAYIPLIHKGLNKKTLLTYPRALFTQKLNFNDIIDNIKYLLGKDRNIIITIGSIITWHTNPKCIIWGSGIMSKNDNVNNAVFLAVRGKYTQKRLEELGYVVPKTIGDPAILSPLVYESKRSTKRFKVGIIPHHFHFDEINSRIKENEEVKIINLLDSVEDVINDINSCEVTITSSLHGIIVSHAYGIKSLWYNLSSKTIGGDDIKFLDYFSSVKLQEYSSFEFDINNFDLSKIYKNVQLNFLKSNPDPNRISHLQKELIKVAPFEVLQKFNNNIK